MGVVSSVQAPQCKEMPGLAITPRIKLHRVQMLTVNYLPSFSDTLTTQKFMQPSFVNGQPTSTFSLYFCSNFSFGL